MDNHFDRRERTIYVWMLERAVTDDQLYTLFSKIGPIEKLIFKEYADGSPQHCLIVFRYVDSVLTAMSTLQGAELNGKPISLRPLRESTHAVLMPSTNQYPPSSSSASSTGSATRERTLTTGDVVVEDHHHVEDAYGARSKARNWDAGSSTGSATSSCLWSPTPCGLEAATEKLAMDDRATMRSSASFSSGSSGSPMQSSSLSPPPPPPAFNSSVIHGSLRNKPWRPSRGPIPAPLLTQSGRFYRETDAGYGSGAAAYSSHANLSHGGGGGAPPPSLLSQIIPPSPGYGSPSPYVPPNQQHRQFFGGSGTASSPRPLFGGEYKASGTGLRGVFSPTAAPEEVVWRQQPPSSYAPPPTPLLSPPGTAGGRSWFDYGNYSVPQAYRGSATEQQLGGGAAGAAAPPLSLGGMLPPNSPPIGQCTAARSTMFDFDGVAAAALAAGATMPRRRWGAPPASARPPLPSGFGTLSARCAPRPSQPPRSAAPFGHHYQNPLLQPSPFAWPDYSYGGRF